MGTTSEKLTYLNNTKEKIRDSINLTGANIGTSDTFRSYADKLKLGYIDIINNGIDTLYNNFPKVSGIGSNLSLTPTYEAPMKLNEIQGNTLQDGTPTPDSPVEIQSVTGLQNINVCGKNLFNINGTITQGTLDKYNNGFTLIKRTNRVIRFVLPKVLPAGTYTLSYDAISVENVSGNYFYVSCQYTNTNIGILNDIILNDSGATFTTTGEFDRLYFFIAGNQSNNATITIDNVQLEQGSTATSYEPYKSNTYEVNLGKNLFDIDAPYHQRLNTGTITINGNELTIENTNNNTHQLVWWNIPVGIGEQITISYNSLTESTSDNNNGINYMFSDEPYTTFVNFDNFIKVNKTNKYATTTATKKYLVIGLRTIQSCTNICNKLQIEKGTQATSYSPYFTPIELNKIGTYQDSIKKSTGKNIITTYNYASSGYINYNYDNSKIGKTMTYSFIPNFSTTNASLYIRANTSISSYKVGTISTITSGTKVSVTFTLTDEQYDTIKNTNGGYIQVYKSGVSMDENSISNPMLEINSQSTSYEPYGKVWYIEKNIGKVVLNGSEGWGLASTYTNNTRFSSSSLILGKTTNLISNYFVEGQGGTDTTNIDTNGTTGALMITIPNNIASTLSQFTTWLSNNNTIVYYILSTPTYTEITNTELIEDLETLYTAKSQEGTTNISITSEDLEMILNVSALKGEV